MLNDILEALGGPADDQFDRATMFFLTGVEEVEEVGSKAKKKEPDQDTRSQDPAVPSPFPHEPRDRVDEFKDQIRQPSEKTMDAKTEWEAALKAKVATGMARSEAVRELVKERPELQIKFLQEANAKHPDLAIHRM